MSVKLTIAIPNWIDRIFSWPVLLYRKCRYGYSFRRIYLDEGLWTILDQQDYYLYGRFKWCLDGHDGKFYAVRGKRVGNEIIKTRLSREIMQAPKGTFVDHHNCNSLDNRRQNLRIATRCQNMQNMKKRKNKDKTSSQYIGVYRDKSRSLWAAQLRADGKVMNLGRFAEEIEAARARDVAAIKYHGDFAHLNFPRENYPDESPLPNSKLKI